MNISTLHPQWIRKELRQLVPLVLTIIVLVLVLMVASMLTEQQSTISPMFLFIAIPALFAVGAGAMSVSQEKETRTLAWLTSMPISPNQLVWSKLVAAIICWAALWVLSLSIIFILNAVTPSLFWLHNFNSPDNHPIYSRWFFYWLVNSFYLLVCSFATAWYFRSTMGALITLMILAAVPIVLRFIGTYIQSPGHALNSSVYDPKFLASMLWLVFSLAIVCWRLPIISRRSLAPVQAPVNLNPYQSAALDVSPTPQTLGPVQGQWTAMLWQFFQQNRTPYLILFAIGILPFLLATVGIIDNTLSNNHSSSWVHGVFVIGTFLATVWTGVLVFHGDGIHERIRFFSDRGVHPIKVWLTRQAFPLAFVCVAALCYRVVLGMEEKWGDSAVSLTALLATMVINFGFSQWVSQVTRNPILGVIGAPIMSLAAMAFLAWAVTFIGIPLLMALLMLLLPLLATLISMRDWMDRRFGWRYWLRHVAFLAVLIALPLGYWYRVVVSVPTMPVAMQLEMTQLARSLGVKDDPDSQHNLLPLHVSMGWFVDSEDLSDVNYAPDEVRATAESTPKEILEGLKLRVRVNGGRGIDLSDSDMLEFEGRILLALQAMQTDPKSESAQQDYRDELELLYYLAGQLRRSYTLICQEKADIAEIALIRELTRPTAKQAIGAELYRSIATLVSDREARMRSRREALAVSWRIFDLRLDQDRTSGSLGGAYFPNSRNRKTDFGYAASRNYNRHVNHGAAVLWQYLEAGPTASREQRRDWLARRFASFDSDEEFNYYQPHWIDYPAEIAVLYRRHSWVGNQWFAGWEDIGESLRSEIP